MSVEDILREGLRHDAQRFGNNPGRFDAAEARAGDLRRRRRVIASTVLPVAAAAVTALTIVAMTVHRSTDGQEIGARQSVWSTGAELDVTHLSGTDVPTSPIVVAGLHWAHGVPAREVIWMHDDMLCETYQPVTTRAVKGGACVGPVTRQTAVGDVILSVGGPGDEEGPAGQKLRNYAGVVASDVTSVYLTTDTGNRVDATLVGAGVLPIQQFTIVVPQSTRIVRMTAMVGNGTATSVEVGNGQ